MKIISFLLLLCISISAGNSKIKERRAVDLRQKDLLVKEIRIPSQEYAGALPHSTAAGPEEGIVIGTTDYDYAINSGFARRIATFDNGKQVHMVFPERDITAPSPNDRRTNKYVMWDAANPGSLVSAYPRIKSAGASGFAGIDVIPAGAGAGIAIMTYTAGGKTYFTIDGAPGAGSFTESEMPAAISDKKIFDPQVTVTPDGNTIWFSANLNDDDVIVARSTDFGGSWIGIDSLKHNLPHTGFSVHAAAPILISSAGALCRIATLRGKGSLPPLGTADPDSADCIGYFSSTNNGAGWTWTTIGRDGEPLVVAAGDTVYTLFENFSQFSGAVGGNGNVHVVSNGYSLKITNDSTASNRFYTLYYYQELNRWRIISDKFEGASADYDSSYYRYSGNAIGHPYPSISCVGDYINVFWSQPVFSGGRLDTSSEFVRYHLWNNVAYRNGGNWVFPNHITDTEGALFPNGATSTNNNVPLSFPVLFLKDTVTGNSVFGEGETKQIPWMFRRIPHWSDPGHFPINIFTWADSGGRIEPFGPILVSTDGSKTFTIAPDSGFQIDSVVVNSVNKGAVNTFTVRSPSTDQYIRAYFSPTVSSVGNGADVPLRMALYDNHPNPFNPTTRIHFELDRDSDVSIDVFDMIGRHAASLVHEYKRAGRHTVTFDGLRLSSGVYIYTMTAGNFSAVRKMVLQK